MNTHEKLLNFLQEQNAKFELVYHNDIAGDRCEDSAVARGLELKYGAKSLLVKANNQFYLFTLSAAKKAQSRLMRKLVGSQKLRFATADELLEQAGVVKGALPPFGRPFFPFAQFVDESIWELDKVAFNAGLLEVSVVMPREGFLSLLEATRATFTEV